MLNEKEIQELINKTRIEWAKNDYETKVKGMKTPKSLIIIKDLEYKKGLKTDIYYPKKANLSNLPLIVDVHGGGYFYGDKELYSIYCMEVARHGFMVVNYDYRLSDVAPYPAQLEDLNDVLNWMIKNKNTYHFNLDKLFLVGDSAGAQMVSQYLTFLTNKEYQKLFSFKAPDLKVRGALLNCGMYKLDFSQAENNPIVAYYFRGKKDSDEDLDVLKYINKDYPPCFIMSAKGDMLVSEAKPFYDYLIQKVLKAKLRIYPFKSLYHVFHETIKLPMAKFCNHEESVYLKSLLK